jgi:hypothetical protein
LSEGANRVSQITATVPERHQDALLPVRVFGSRHAAETAERRPARVVRREALSDILLGGFIEVRADFPTQVSIEIARASRRAYAREEHPETSHDASS